MSEIAVLSRQVEQGGSCLETASWVSTESMLTVAFASGREVFTFARQEIKHLIDFVCLDKALYFPRLSH